MNAASLQHATEAARSALASLSNDVLAVADVLATAFGLPFPDSLEASPATLPGATERVCEAFDAVTRTCSSAADQLRAATRRTAAPVAGNRLERIDNAARSAELFTGDHIVNGVVVTTTEQRDNGVVEPSYAPGAWTDGYNTGYQSGLSARLASEESDDRGEPEEGDDGRETITGDPLLVSIAEQIVGGPVEAFEAEITGDGVRYIVDDDGDADDWPNPEEGDKIIAEGDQDEAEIEALEDAAGQGGDPELDIGEQPTDDGRKANRKARRRATATGRRKK